MFEKFGEFDSWEEINKAAEAQFNQGEMDAIRIIAAENGLDKEDAEDFIKGEIDELTIPSLAALGKLNVECEELKLKGVLLDWVEELKRMCIDDMDFAVAVRKKGKRLSDCLGNILKGAFEAKTQLPEQIVRAAGLRPPIYLGIPDKKQRKEIALAYYCG